MIVLKEKINKDSTVSVLLEVQEIPYTPVMKFTANYSEWTLRDTVIRELKDSAIAKLTEFHSLVNDCIDQLCWIEWTEHTVALKLTSLGTEHQRIVDSGDLFQTAGLLDIKKQDERHDLVLSKLEKIVSAIDDDWDLLS